MSGRLMRWVCADPLRTVFFLLLATIPFLPWVVIALTRDVP